MRHQLKFWLLLAAFAMPIPSRAVIFYSTGDINYNTTAPGGSTNAAWSAEGEFSSYLGTPIAANYFITAQHFGGSVGSSFVYGGSTYTTTALYRDPNSDLAIWQVNNPFPNWAPLYTGSDEVGQSAVIVGRGTQRGDVVVASNGTTNGWLWGTQDGVKRWGENVIDGAVNAHGTNYLYANFDAGAGPNECTLSSGDSGGAMFIWTGSAWALAGINYGVEGPFNTTNSGSGFSAAVYNANGLYIKDGGWQLVTNDIAAAFYVTRISTEIDWINSVVPEPSSLTLVGFSLLALLARCRATRRCR